MVVDEDHLGEGTSTMSSPQRRNMIPAQAFPTKKQVRQSKRRLRDVAGVAMPDANGVLTVERASRQRTMTFKKRQLVE